MKKSKFSQCISCPLKDQEMVIGETNSPDNLQDINVLILAEAPAVKEVDLKRPLMGKAGKIFRRIFKISKLENLPHYIGNIVFCSNLYVDENTGKRKTNNPPKTAIELCRPNWQTLIRVTRPKYILALGANVKNSFGIFGSMEETRGKFYKYDGEKLGISYDPEILVTYHPSFIGRGVATSKQINDFENDFKLLYTIITGESLDGEHLNIKRDKLKLKKPYFYEIPSWMKTEEIMLVDIQSPPSSNEIIYIFRDKDGKRRYHFDNSGDYYYYRGEGILQNSPVLNRIEDVELIQGQCLDSHTAPLYEGDVKIEMKHSIDYYMQRKTPEPDIPLKKMFFDIEVYSYGDKAFPEPKLAKAPVNAISFKIDDGPLNVFFVDPCKLINSFDNDSITEKDITDMNLDFNVRIFQSEKVLLIAFAREITKSEVDIITGWSSNGFDIPTINNRMKKIGIDPNILSPIGKTFVNPYRYGDIFIGGLYSLDMLETYKGLTENKKESNKLGAISRIELGEGKVEFEGSLDELYETNIKNFIRYSGQDTNLLYELDKKLGHIKLLKKMKQICHTTWKGTENTTGLLDPLLISFAKNRGMVMRNAESVKKDWYPGAYVINSKMGLYSWLVDLDYTSLYPSIIISYNIGPETFIGKIDPKIAKTFIYKRDELPDNIKVITNPMLSEEFQIYKNMSKEEFTKWVFDNEGIVNIAGSIFIGHSKKMSFIAEVNQLLLDTRVIYKDKMKEARKKEDPIWNMYYNIQWAYKILANSIYGFMGLASSRLFKLDLARSITLPGQELLKFAGTHLTNYMVTGDKSINPDFIDNFENMDKKYLIYGDTDSIFLDISEYLMDKKLL